MSLQVAPISDLTEDFEQVALTPKAEKKEQKATLSTTTNGVEDQTASKTMTLGGKLTSEKIQEKIQQNPQVEVVVWINGEGSLEPLAHAQKLRELRLINYKTCSQLGKLAKVNSLVSLTIAGSLVKDYLKDLSTSSQLQELNLINLLKVTDFEMNSLLPSLKNLKTLILNGIPGITALSIVSLKHCPELNKLHLAQTSVKDSALQMLALTLKKLEELDLRGCKQITSKGIQDVLKIKSLKKLILSKDFEKAGLQGSCQLEYQEYNEASSTEEDSDLEFVEQC